VFGAHLRHVVENIRLSVVGRRVRMLNSPLSMEKRGSISAKLSLLINSGQHLPTVFLRNYGYGDVHIFHAKGKSCIQCEGG